ncbi:MAG: GNAT family N-acetyltransferase [Roseobacter sp.]|nr:GNAT family N-acetyltransferase [Roseobacter sp.]
MIVTYLEMRSPQYHGSRLPDGVRFEPFAADVESYRALFRRVGQEWLWYGRLRMPAAELAATLAHPDVHLFTLTKAGKPEALLELDFRVQGACELAYFGLTDALIGSGAGAYLMDRAVERAFETGIKRFHVHTCTIDSPRALGFYRRSGFTAVRQEVEIDDDPRVSGLLPSHAGPHVPLIRS